MRRAGWAPVISSLSPWRPADCTASPENLGFLYLEQESMRRSHLRAELTGPLPGVVEVAVAREGNRAIFVTGSC